MSAALSMPPHSLSIVVPFYNEEDNIAPLVKRVHEATGTLEDRIDELRQADMALKRQQEEVALMSKAIESALGASLAAHTQEVMAA